MLVFRIALIALALAQAALAGLGMLISTFADGGYWWERLPMLLAHPAGAAALLALAAQNRPSGRFLGIALALLLANVAADASLSAAIGLGVTRGDWWLPLVFSAIPAVGVVYTLTLLNRGGRSAPPAPAVA